MSFGERDPNTVGQIYRIPEGASCDRPSKSARLRAGDLVLCLEHTGDCHYEWARLDYETRTQSTHCNLPVNTIKNYYNAGALFSGYALPEEWEILQEPLSHEAMLGVLIAMRTSHRSGLLLPLFPDERAEYLEEQERIRKEALPPEVRDAEDDVDDGDPKLKEWPTCKTCGRAMMVAADDCGGDCSTCVAAAEAGT